MDYRPRPIDTTSVLLPPNILTLTEHLAVNAHEVWAAQRLSEGWSCGPQRSDPEKKTPNLVPYDKLPETEKEYDREIVLRTLKALYAMGYQIIKKD